jgi:hypothetical protein
VPSDPILSNIEEKLALDQKREINEEFASSQSVNIHKHSRKTKKRANHVERQEKNRVKAQLKRRIRIGLNWKSEVAWSTPRSCTLQLNCCVIHRVCQKHS